MDEPITIATWLVPALSVLGSLAYALRERSKRLALVAATALENERQESVVQAHLLARLTAMDTRLAQLDDTNRLQAGQIRDLERTNQRQADQISGLNATLMELGNDKARLAMRVIELENEVSAANGRAAVMKRELEESLDKARPSTLSERPGRS